MTEKFDTIVIGAGPGGMAVASALASKQRVLVVEKGDWGGTCPNRGCDPKKILYGVVDNYLQAQRFHDDGMPTMGQLDWSKLVAFEKSYTKNIPTNMVAGLKAAGAKTLAGEAAFVNDHMIAVNGATYETDNFVIAAGAEPRILDIPGQDYLKTSTDFLKMTEMPKRIGFIGGGFVTLELANIANAVGAEVHIFQHNHRLLETLPQSATDRLAKILGQRGVKFHWQTTVSEINKDQGALIAQTSDGSVPVDMLISAVGRPAALNGLNLQHAGVATDNHGIKVDDHLRTSQSHIYAIGDIGSKRIPKLTGVAGFEGAYVARTILGATAPIIYPAIPFIAFTSPQLGQVGLTVDQAMKEPDRYEIKVNEVGQWYNYFRLRDQDAQITTVVDKKTGLLVGAVVMAHDSEELMNRFAQIISLKQTPADLAKSIAVYPSFSSDLGYLY
ncbi:dihydrolipoyl dehydrogenase family protein [Lapidilactobacillus wuchangensis]|uniref:dihydrolipoyl dehydrogenase family protein n=1 Tax=Lapidilactobacillus wuchangensis TaxID=2486001 RepID=UPI000F771E37|nr:NAD(P)/FAD-dependent oxidoreductase [Lapidilactobacillus wuchangensis]